MKTLILKIRFGILAAVFLVSVITAAQSQPADKAMERIDMLKKMKLLEILELDDAAADKFLIKYNSYENQLKSKKEAIDDASDDMRRGIRKGMSKEDLVKKTDQLIQMQVELQNLYIEKLKAMKSFLNEEQYAKYVVFEERFAQELRKNLFKMFKDRGKGD